jgi:hypothetical protein
VIRILLEDWAVAATFVGVPGVDVPLPPPPFPPPFVELSQPARTNIAVRTRTAKQKNSPRFVFMENSFLAIVLYLYRKKCRLPLSLQKRPVFFGTCMIFHTFLDLTPEISLKFSGVSKESLKTMFIIVIKSL